MKYSGEASLSAEGQTSWIDVTLPMHNGMVCWPGDANISIRRVVDMEKGATANVTAIAMGSHTGTHMDAPLHFVNRGLSIDQMPLDTTIGRARVIEIHDAESIKIEELLPHHIHSGERIIFKTRNSLYAWQAGKFVEDYVYVSEAAAEHLVERGVKVVGVDYLSVDSYGRGGGSAHKVLLGNGVWIIEGLDLSQVSAGEYELVCLPLRLKGVDGSPARALLRTVL